jgi:hypothetical protein
LLIEEESTGVESMKNGKWSMVDELVVAKGLH